jgi:ribonuclease E
VEQRLRDALRTDRARVQFSSISKFGLLEMSRQRLRPALSEGSHITCPRCNGTGHIRDTESSALQILRIIQEESMKDNTAAVHVQVPVEVTSFLLNEKRTEITKIELKQRVTVLLIPNKHIETPNYKLERLRHDDPRLENIQTSYSMIEEPDDEVGITRREKAKAKQEPIIKGVLPDQPAPMAMAPHQPVLEANVEIPHVAPTPAVPAPEAASGGFFGWLKRLFGMGSPAAEAPAITAAPVVTPAEEAKDAGKGQGRGRRDGQRRGERAERGERGERGGEGRRERQGERGEKGEGRQGRRAPREDRPVSAEGGNETPRSDEGAREGRRGRGGRGGERNGERTPINREAIAAEAQALALAAEPGTAEAAATAEAERENGRRRRRGGRGRAERDEAQTQIDGLNAPEAIGTEAEEATSVPAQPSQDGEPAEGERRRRGGRDRNRGERAPRAEGADSDVRSEVAEQAAAPMATSPAPVAAEVPSAEVTQVSAPVEAAPAAAAVVVAEVVAQAAEASVAPAAEPVVVAEAAPAAVATPFVLPLPELEAIARNAGLEWVNSDADKIRAVQEAIAKEPKPVHVPRERKPVVVQDEGPLILVETRKDLKDLTLPFEDTASA